MGHPVYMYVYINMLTYLFTLKYELWVIGTLVHHKHHNRIMYYADILLNLLAEVWFYNVICHYPSDVLISFVAALFVV